MKHFLRTYALGLLTATLIIGIYYFYFLDQEVLIEKIEMTEAEMVSSLEDAGYYIYETDPEIVVPDDVLPDDSDTAEEREQEPENDELEDGSDSSELPDQTPDDNTDELEDNEDLFVLTIEAGMTISQVADYLIVANIIENRNEFASYLVEHNYGTNIQIGEFELNRNMTLAEIAEIIAKQNE